MHSTGSIKAAENISGTKPGEKLDDLAFDSKASTYLQGVMKITSDIGERGNRLVPDSIIDPKPVDQPAVPSEAGPGLRRRKTKKASAATENRSTEGAPAESLVGAASNYTESTEIKDNGAGDATTEEKADPFDEKVSRHFTYNSVTFIVVAFVHLLILS